MPAATANMTNWRERGTGATDSAPLKTAQRLVVRQPCRHRGREHRHGARLLVGVRTARDPPVWYTPLASTVKKALGSQRSKRRWDPNSQKGVGISTVKKALGSQRSKRRRAERGDGELMPRRERAAAHSRVQQRLGGAQPALRRRVQQPRHEAPPTRVRCVSIFLDKNRRYIGKSQSKRPPQRTQRTPHPSSDTCAQWASVQSGPPGPPPPPPPPPPQPRYAAIAS
jgi:hypothetical protein